MKVINSWRKPLPVGECSVNVVRQK